MKIMVNAFDNDDKPYDRDPSKNTFAQFLVNAGLYDKYEVTQTNIQDLIDVLCGNVRVNIFCKECGETRTYTMGEVMFPMEGHDGNVMRSLGKELEGHQHVQKLRDTPRPGEQNNESEWYWTNWQTQEYTRVMVFQYRCAFDEQHFTDYVVRSFENTIVKIGQYPTVADMTFPELENYKKVISKEDRKELRRAIGLYASGIGAGSYVYLRRIFERILFTARKNAGDAIGEEVFNNAHVNQKITMLKDYLPNMLTSNPTLYGVISKGIHELSEEECLAYFPVVKDCIFMILDEWEEIRKKQEKEKTVNAALSKIASIIK